MAVLGITSIAARLLAQKQQVRRWRNWWFRSLRPNAVMNLLTASGILTAIKSYPASGPLLGNCKKHGNV
jgi:hypothetical protein